MEAESPSATGNMPELTVSELSQALKRAVEDQFGFVRVRGELSGVKRHTSGHIYLDLKDDKAVLAGVIWKGSAQRMAVQPETGLEVVATGRLTTYPGQSKYQIVIERLELAGLGAIMKMLEERRKKLLAEGLFAPERKKKLPFLPGVIGVVTSPTGAVIRDILHRLADRFPRHVLLWPVAVQGEKAADEIARAIAGFNALPPNGKVPRPDVLIVARGGGSFEDLLPFSEEVVVRAAAASAIPLISAVGHETDTTLIDFAADVRAPTPTAAAEMAVPVRSELMARIGTQGERLSRALTRNVEVKREGLRGLARALPRAEDLTGPLAQRLDGAAFRFRDSLKVLAGQKRNAFHRVAAALSPSGLRTATLRKREAATNFDQRRRLAFARLLERANARLSGFGKLLEALSHKATLARGFVLVRGADGSVRRQAASLLPHENVTLSFADGEAKAVIAEGGAAPAAPPASPKAKRGGSASGQGQLF